MTSNSFYIDNASRNIAATVPTTWTALTFEQKLQKFGMIKELEEKYPEKEANKKMKGSRKYVLSHLNVICLIHQLYVAQLYF